MPTSVALLIIAVIATVECTPSFQEMSVFDHNPRHIITL